MANLYARDLVGYSKTPIIKPNKPSIGGRLRRYSAVLNLGASTTTNADGNDTVAVTTSDNVLLARVPAGATFDFGMITSSVSLSTSTLSIGVATASATGSGSSGANQITVSGITGNIAVGQEVSGTGIGTGAVVTAVNNLTVTLSVVNSGSVSGTITFGSASRYASALTQTSTNVPLVFGSAVGQNGAALPSDTLVYLTVGTTNLPSSGTVVIDLYFNQP